MKNFLVLHLCCYFLLACNHETTTKQEIEDTSKKEVQANQPTFSVTIEEELFKISFPEFPEKTEDSIDRTVEYLVSQKSDSVRFLLYYRDYKPESISRYGGAEKFLDNQERQVIEGQKFAQKDILENKKISLEGYPGLALKAGSADNFFLVYRIYLVENRVYQLGISSMLKYPTEKEVESFFGSFKLKNKTPKVSKS